MHAVTAPLPVSRQLEAIPPKERRRYSLARAISRVAQAGVRGLDGIERQVSDELSRHAGTRSLGGDSFLVPLDTRTADEVAADAYATRTLTTNAPRLGAELVPGGVLELVTLLRARLASVSLGATFLPDLPGPVSVPAQVGGVTATWLSEAPAAPGVAQTDPTFGFRLFMPKTLMAATAVSRSLLATGAIGVEQMVRDEIAAAFAAALDRALFHGSGASNEPAGIYATASVTSVAFGGAPTLTLLLQLLETLAVANADRPDAAIATTPAVARRLSFTQTFAGASNALWSGPFGDGVVAGHRAIATNSVRGDLGAGAEHGLVAGSFSEALLGTVGAIEMIVDPFTSVRQGLVNVTGILLADVLLRRPESFVRAGGLTLP